MGDALPYVDLGTRLGLPPPLAGPVEVRPLYYYYYGYHYEYGQLTDAIDHQVFDVVAGQGHFCALIKDSGSAWPAVRGVVKCWGGGPNLFQVSIIITLITIIYPVVRFDGLLGLGN